jgi:flavin-dependent dehydrogenase
VHPDAVRRTNDLDVWLDRSVIRHGYAWNVPAAGEQRVGVGSYEPRDHVKEPTREMARRLDVDAVRYQGNWFPHRLRAAAEDGVYFAGDSAGHCIPLSGEGIRTALCFGDRAGREIRAGSLAAYGAFSERHRGFYEFAYAAQTLVTRIPPRLLQGIFDLLGRPRLCRPAFAWYLRQVPPPSEARHAPGEPHVHAAAEPEEPVHLAARQPAQL